MKWEKASKKEREKNVLFYFDLILDLDPYTEQKFANLEPNIDACFMWPSGLQIITVSNVKEIGEYKLPFCFSYVFLDSIEIFKQQLEYFAH